VDSVRDELDAAGLPKLVPYSLRHTFASFAIAAGVSLFYLARLLGTSVEQITAPTGTCCPTRRNTCEDSSTTSMRLPPQNRLADPSRAVRRLGEVWASAQSS
jgi:integrase